MKRGWVVVALIALTSCTVNPAERNNAGNQLLADGNYEGAIAAYQSAQIIDPDNAVYNFNSSQALTGMNRLLEAQSALQQVIDGGNSELIADAWYNLGNLYFETGDFDSAVLAYREALLIDPGHDDARYNLELANAFEITPTPTAIEMQSEIEEQDVNEEATPTPNPAGEINPTPTPTPRDVIPPTGETPENIGDDETGEKSENPSTPDPIPDGEMDVEDAEDMLEPIEASQERISTFRDNYNETGEQSAERDW